MKRGGWMDQAMAASMIPEEPSWAATDLGARGEDDERRWEIEMIKGGVSLGKRSIEKSRWLLGRAGDVVDIEFSHSSISRIHAILQRSREGRLYLYDCSSHGTRLNKTACPKGKYVELRAGDVMNFGESARILTVHSVFQEDTGPRPVRLAEEVTTTTLLPKQDATWGFEEEKREDEVPQTERHCHDTKLLEKLEAKQKKVQRLQTEINRLRAKQDLSEGQSEMLKRAEIGLARLQDNVADMEASLEKRRSSRKVHRKKDDDLDDDSTMRDLTQKLAPARSDADRAERRRMRFTAGHQSQVKLQTVSYDDLLAMRTQLEETQAPDLQRQQLNQLIQIAKPALPGLSHTDTSAAITDSDETQKLQACSTAVTSMPKIEEELSTSDETRRRKKKQKVLSQDHMMMAVAPSLLFSKPAAPPEKKPPHLKDSSKNHSSQKDLLLEGGDTVWHPPSNQDGSGRTALNDILGY